VPDAASDGFNKPREVPPRKESDFHAARIEGKYRALTRTDVQAMYDEKTEWRPGAFFYS
jgi:hypothetical protein